MQLKNAGVLITGGSKGIGRATAALLKEAGALVAITGRNAERLHKTATQLGVVGIQADVSQEDEVLRTYEEFFSRIPRLDVLVNNAAFGRRASLVDIETRAFDKLWRTNVLGATLMAREAAKVFRAQKSGNIVNIASTAGLRGYETGTMYVASKFALRGMTECWRSELRRDNVRVMLVNPSEVTTAFGSADGVERAEQSNKLRGAEIAHAIKSALEMDDRGFITDLTVFATNPW